MSAIFVLKTACQIIKFFPKNRKNPPRLDYRSLFRKWAALPPRNRTERAAEIEPRIHPECGCYGFMIRYGICSKKRKICFWTQKSGSGFSQNPHPKPQWHIKKQLGMFFNILVILSKFAIQRSNHMASMSQWNSLQIGILSGDSVSTHWIPIGEFSLLGFKYVLTPGVFNSNFNLWNKSTVTLRKSRLWL